MSYSSGGPFPRRGDSRDRLAGQPQQPYSSPQPNWHDGTSPDSSPWPQTNPSGVEPAWFQADPSGTEPAWPQVGTASGGSEWTQPSEPDPGASWPQPGTGSTEQTPAAPFPATDPFQTDSSGPQGSGLEPRAGQPRSTLWIILVVLALACAGAGLVLANYVKTELRTQADSVDGYAFVADITIPWSIVLGVLPVIAILLGTAAMRSAKRPQSALPSVISTLVFLAAIGSLIFAQILGSAESALRGENGAIDSVGTQDAFSLEVGDCMASIDSENVASVTAIPCAEPHAGQIFSSRQLSLPAFNDTEVRQQAAEVCDEDFAELDLGEVDSDGIGYYSIFPTKGSWAQLGDREVQCTIYAWDGEQLRGSVLNQTLVVEPAK